MITRTYPGIKYTSFRSFIANAKTGVASRKRHRAVCKTPTSPDVHYSRLCYAGGRQGARARDTGKTAGTNQESDLIASATKTAGNPSRSQSCPLTARGARLSRPLIRLVSRLVASQISVARNREPAGVTLSREEGPRCDRKPSLSLSSISGMPLWNVGLIFRPISALPKIRTSDSRDTVLSRSPVFHDTYSPPPVPFPK